MCYGSTMCGPSAGQVMRIAGQADTCHSDRWHMACGNLFWINSCSRIKKVTYPLHIQRTLSNSKYFDHSNQLNRGLQNLYRGLRKTTSVLTFFEFVFAQIFERPSFRLDIVFSHSYPLRRITDCLGGWFSLVVDTIGETVTATLLWGRAVLWILTGFNWIRENSSNSKQFIT